MMHIFKRLVFVQNCFEIMNYIHLKSVNMQCIFHCSLFLSFFKPIFHQKVKAFFDVFSCITLLVLALHA